MDLQMPVMDGYEATVKIRSEAAFAKLPIIAMTAHATIEEKQKCLDAGMNDHISKPIDPNILFETVGRFYQPPPVTEPVGQTVAVDIQHPEELPAIDGLDTQDGLTRVAGNRKLYLKLLRQFAEQQGPAVAEITAALAQRTIPHLPSASPTRSRAWPRTSGPNRCKPPPACWRKSSATAAAASETEPALQQVAKALDPLLVALKKSLPSRQKSSQLAAGTQPPPVDPAQTRRGCGTTCQTALRLRLRRGGIHRGQPGGVECHCFPARPGRSLKNSCRIMISPMPKRSWRQALKNSNIS